MQAQSALKACPLCRARTLPLTAEECYTNGYRIRFDVKNTMKRRGLPWPAVNGTVILPPDLQADMDHVVALWQKGETHVRDALSDRVAKASAFPGPSHTSTPALTFASSISR